MNTDANGWLTHVSPRPIKRKRKQTADASQNREQSSLDPIKEKQLVLLERKLRQLRQKHTELAGAGKWQEAQTSQKKIIEHLNRITRKFPDWHEQSFALIDRPEETPIPSASHNREECEHVTTKYVNQCDKCGQYVKALREYAERQEAEGDPSGFHSVQRLRLIEPRGKHSPLPWTQFNEKVIASGHNVVVNIVSEYDERQYLVAEVYGRNMGEAEANTKLIVASVNHAGKLAEALRQIAENKLSNDNCASVELAGKRCANIARQALTDYEKAKQ